MKVSLMNYLTTEAGEDKEDLTLHSFEIPKGHQLQAGRFVTVYGNKAIQKTLGEARKNAMAKGETLYRVNMALEGPEQPAGRIGVEDLPNIWFLNFERIKDDLNNLIKEKLDSISGIDTLGHSHQIIAEYPAVLDVLWATPEFEHIMAFSWNAPAAPKSKVKFIKLVAVKEISFLKDIELQGVPTTESRTLTLAS